MQFQRTARYQAAEDAATTMMTASYGQTAAEALAAAQWAAALLGTTVRPVAAVAAVRVLRDVTGSAVRHLAVLAA
jgi:hypothetical protein